MGVPLTRLGLIRSFELLMQQDCNVSDVAHSGPCTKTSPDSYVYHPVNRLVIDSLIKGSDGEYRVVGRETSNDYDPQPNI